MKNKKSQHIVLPMSFSTRPSPEGQNRVNFFDTEETASRMYKNQQDYEATQALKAANEKARQGK